MHHVKVLPVTTGVDAFRNQHTAKRETTKRILQDWKESVKNSRK